MTYYPSNNRLNTITSTSGQTTIQNLSYHYYDNGSISAITDGTPTGASQTFTYDGLNRLTDAQIGQSSELVQFVYTPSGNILSNSRIGTYGYGEDGSGGASRGNVGGRRGKHIWIQV